MFNKLSGKQIKPGALDQSHLSPSTKLPESMLNVDWSAKASEALASKLIVDFVQVAGVKATGKSVDVTASISAPVADADDKKGAVVQAGKNKVILRDSVTGDPVISADHTEVYGKLGYSGSAYTVSFFYKDATKAEKEYTFASEKTIDFQFPQRFDLLTIVETFASNEKFVDGASDVSARLDLEQIAKDAFGASYTLDRDGNPNRAKSLVESVTERTQGTLNSQVTASDLIDEVVEARGGEDTLEERLVKLAGSNQEVIDARSSTTLGDKATLDERLEAGELIVDGIKKDITAAVGNSTLAAIITDLQQAMTESGHTHFSEDKQIQAGDPIIDTNKFLLSGGKTFVPGNKSLEVFVNGQLQMEGVHYVEVKDDTDTTKGIGVDFTPETIVKDMVIQLRWYK